MGVGNYIAAVSFVLAASAAAAQAPAFVPATALVIRVYDGDTVRVRSGIVEWNVRLLGIDAPEKDGPYTKAEPFGAEAGRRAAELALWKTVALKYGGDRLKDKYGRLLAHVILPDGRSLNEIMLTEGLAEAFHSASYTLKKRYHRLEAQARAACLGVWKSVCGNRGGK